MVFSIIHDVLDDFVHSITCGDDTSSGFTPAAYALWLKLDTLARTAWNTAAKQLNNSGTGGGLDGVAASGVAISGVQANSDAVFFDAVTLTDEFIIAFYGVDISTEGLLINSGSSDSDYIRPKASTFEARFNNSAKAFSGSANSDGDHWTIIRDSSDDVTVYKNGAAYAASQNYPGTVTLDALFRWQTTSYYTGAVKDLEIFSSDTAYTAAEIFNNPQDFLARSQHANSELALLCAEAEGVDDPILYDYSNNKIYSFSTSAGSPYDPWVKGIEVGFQPALADFNRYDWFDGSDDYYNLGGQVSHLNNTTNSWRILIENVVWNGVGGCIWSQKDDTGDDEGVAIGVVSSNGRVRVEIADNGGGIGANIYRDNTSTPLVAGTFYDSIEVTYDGSQAGTGITIKVNGESSPTYAGGGTNLTITNITPTANAGVGARRLEITPNQYFSGLIGSVKLWDNNSGGTQLHQWSGGDGYQDSIGSLNGTEFGSPVKQNYLGTSFGATTDVFGNAVANVRPNDLGFNGLGGNHSGAVSSMEDISGGGCFGFWHKPIENTTQRVFEMASNNPSVTWSSGTYYFLPDNDAILSGKDKDDWNFVFVNFESGGDYEVYWGNQDTEPTLITSLNMATAWATTTEITIGQRSNGNNKVLGLIGSDFVMDAGDQRTLAQIIELYNYSKARMGI